MHNLSTVIRFEIVRALKKKSFWILAISFPLMFAAIFGIIFLSNKATDDAAEKLKNQSFSIAITDESKLVKPQLIAAAKATEIKSSDKQLAINRVKNGQLDAYIYYPKNLDQQSVEVYGKDVGIFDNGRYSSLANSLLSTSVQSGVDPAIQKIIQGKISSTSTVYRDGKVHDSIQEMILPGVFLILFYFLITFFGNQMLTSTTEEKENRVIEMILTTIEARTLIIGKIISLIVLAIIQGLLIVLPVLTGYLLFHDQLKLPSVDLSSLPIDPLRIGIGFLVFASSFMLFTGLLVAIGAAVPTAKEANSFFGIVMILLFGPLYAITMFISIPDSPLVKFLSLFPLTSPIPLMLRNAAGNLGVSEAIIGIAILIISATIIMAIAVRIFRFGALEYSRKLSAREIFARK
ncbi:MAG: ABC transporter permease [Candidatus Nanogingivalaceae bacterium]|nr:ABC transporter permease [Candidatus Nanogingivalaceae bacterium]